MNFSDEFVARCKAAMSKSAPQDALRLVASGRVTIEVTTKGDINLDTLDGQPIRDQGHRMGLAGAWPLVAAGMVDQFGVVTEDGRAFLEIIGAGQ